MRRTGDRCRRHAPPAGYPGAWEFCDGTTFPAAEPTRRQRQEQGRCFTDVPLQRERRICRRLACRAPRQPRAERSPPGDGRGHCGRSSRAHLSARSRQLERRSRRATRTCCTASASICGRSDVDGPSSVSRARASPARSQLGASGAQRRSGGDRKLGRREARVKKLSAFRSSFHPHSLVGMALPRILQSFRDYPSFSVACKCARRGTKTASACSRAAHMGPGPQRLFLHWRLTHVFIRA
jgi:hypothetical protein